MSDVQEAVPGQAAPDRRQRKKQLTKDALIAAALELFAAQGYDRTAVHEITDAVDVSERTFFRYFASKEDLVLSFIRDGTIAFAEALTAQPAQEEPLTAARNALQVSLRELSGGQGLPNYLSAMRLIDATPTLLAAYLRYAHDQDGKIIEVLARREGVDPGTDRRPRVLAAVLGALVFLSDREWRAGDNPDPDAMAATFDAYVDAVIPALSGHWDSRHGDSRHGDSRHGDAKQGDATSSTTVPMARPSAT
jgi:AcrR family transcriptional regulator